MLSTYGATRRACYTGYVIQAIIANLAPILFIVFQNEYGLKLTQISVLILVNFSAQLIIDVIATKYVDRMGYRTAAIIAHVCAAAGLILFGVVPLIFTDVFSGLLMAIVLYAIGGGFIEVLVSPIVDAIPSERKHANMSFLHSFYSWGQVLVVLATTLYIKLFGNDFWYILPFAYALIPLLNLVAFIKVPLPKTYSASEKTPMKTLLKKPIFWLAMVVMTCAGASELIMSQWASLFAERGLGVSKFVGDLLGPCAFAVFMSLGRMAYGLWGDKLPMRAMLIGSGALCIACYLVTALVPNAVVSLLGCAFTGLAVSLMWPGMLAETGTNFPRGGTTMFGVLAIMGDLGCTGGPSLIGLIADAVAQNQALVDFGAGFGLDATQTGLRAGILLGTVVPILLLAAMLVYARITRRRKPHSDGADGDTAKTQACETDESNPSTNGGSNTSRPDNEESVDNESSTELAGKALEALRSGLPD